MKKGITLVVLVITLVVIAIITTTVLINVNNNNLINNTKDAVLQLKRSETVKSITNNINLERIKKEASGTYLFTNSDLFSLLQNYGTFDHNSLYLSTFPDEDQITFDISLFEVYDVDVDDFVIPVIAENILTVTYAKDFDDTKYKLKYSINDSTTWIDYSSPVTLVAEDSVDIRLLDLNDRVLAQIDNVVN